MNLSQDLELATVFDVGFHFILLIKRTSYPYGLNLMHQTTPYLKSQLLFKHMENIVELKLPVFSVNFVADD